MLTVLASVSMSKCRSCVAKTYWLCGKSGLLQAMMYTLRKLVSTIVWYYMSFPVVWVLKY